MPCPGIPNHARGGRPLIRDRPGPGTPGAAGKLHAHVDRPHVVHRPAAASGSVTYTISQDASQAAPNTVPCNGGSACQWEKGFFTVYPEGTVQVRITNV